jgi:CubicO group peptidase (beta-lactamase class C family)
MSDRTASRRARSSLRRAQSSLRRAQLTRVRAILSVGLAATLSAWAVAPAALLGQNRAAIDRFEARIAADVDADGVGGISAAVFRGDQVLWASGFGWADPDRRIPAGVRTIYRIGSISKSFTAFLLVELVQDGVIDLDEPVVDVLPEIAGLTEPPPGMAPITFRQLASHSAGLIREPDLEGAAAGPIADWGHKILESIPHTSFFAMPGTEYRYSNIGFGILGYALQRAAGGSFMTLVERRIFRPLDLESSTFILGRRLEHRLAVGFAPGPNGSVDSETPAMEHAGRGYKVPNGGIYSTVSDLASFAAAVMGRTSVEVLSPDMRAEMMRPQTPASSETKYGLGLSLSDVELDDGRTVTFVGHGGSVAGYNAYLVFEPRSGLGVVLLRNYNRGATNLSRAAGDLLRELVAADS